MLSEPLPRNPSGKVPKAAARELYLSMQDA